MYIASVNNLSLSLIVLFMIYLYSKLQHTIQGTCMHVHHYVHCKLDYYIRIGLYQIPSQCLVLFYLQLSSFYAVNL